MRIGFATMALASAFVIAAPALAGNTSASAPANANEIVCKSLAPATGTRLGSRRVCKTQGEWDRERQQAQDTLSRTQIQRSPTDRSN